MNSPDMPDQGTNSFKKPVFSWLTIIFGAGAALTGMLGIIGMIFGIPLFTSFFLGYKTIAFSASVIWIIFGSMLACHAATPFRGNVRTVTAAVVALIAIFAALEFRLNILGKHFIVETWSVQIADAISTQPTTPISPVALVIIIPAAIALVFMLYAFGPSKEEEQARNVVGILGLAISVLSFTFFLSYIYGVPFLYGTPIIPIAFASTIAALLIGAGLITAAGSFAIPLKYITGPSTRAHLLRVFLPLTLIIIFVQTFLMVTATSYYNIHNAILFSVSVVVFSIVTTYIVGKVSGGVSYAIDRAERERNGAEEALRESEERLSIVLNTYGEDLERKVVERTSDLSDDNLKLITEIGVRLDAEMELTKVVGQKEVLLREVHHRVKNNLQIIASLLNLQSRYITDEQTLAAIKESQNRVKAIALVHEKLYQSKDISKIEFDDYIRFLGNSLFQFLGMKGRGITLTVDIRDISLAIDTAIPLGLIINELISNSLKHAFPDGRKGDISLAIHRQDHTITILFKDNGVGIPQDFDWQNAKSLGLRLVVSLVEQLQGTIELDRTAGTVFNIVVIEKQ